MTPEAVCFPSVESGDVVASLPVDQRWDRFEVGRVDALPDPAQVVDLVPGRDRTDLPFPDEIVGVVLLALELESDVPVFVECVAGPEPTALARRDMCVEAFRE
jgi:hypothetical protein